MSVRAERGPWALSASLGQVANRHVLIQPQSIGACLIGWPVGSAGSAFTHLAPPCPPSARSVGAKTTPSAWLQSYAKNHRSWRAWLRTAQVGQFGGDFGLPARLLGAPQTIPEDAQAELGHCAKQEWVAHCHQALAGLGLVTGPSRPQPPFQTRPYIFS